MNNENELADYYSHFDTDDDNDDYDDDDDNNIYENVFLKHVVSDRIFYCRPPRYKTESDYCLCLCGVNAVHLAYHVHNSGHKHRSSSSVE